MLAEETHRKPSRLCALHARRAPARGNVAHIQATRGQAVTEWKTSSNCSCLTHCRGTSSVAPLSNSILHQCTPLLHYRCHYEGVLMVGRSGRRRAPLCLEERLRMRTQRQESHLSLEKVFVARLQLGDSRGWQRWLHIMRYQNYISERRRQRHPPLPRLPPLASGKSDTL